MINNKGSKSKSNKKEVAMAPKGVLSGETTVVPGAEASSTMK